MNLYTTSDLAAALGKPERTVRWHIQQLGIPVRGNTYVLTDEEARKVWVSVRNARPGPKTAAPE